MTPSTYAEARAACVVRWGREPDDELLYDGCPVASWAAVPGDVARVGGTIALTELDELVLSVARGHERARWVLAGDDLTDDDVTPLPAALDAADAFLRTHATTATKGP